MKPLDGLASSIFASCYARDGDPGIATSQSVPSMAADLETPPAVTIHQRGVLADAIVVAGAPVTRPAPLHDPLVRRRAMSHWLDRLAAAITSRTALDEVLRLVHHGLVNACGFDRVGIYLYNADQRLLQGVWGTDREGKLMDISQVQVPVSADNSDPFSRIVRGELDYYLTADHTDRHWLLPNDSMYAARAHVQIPICSNGAVAGVLCADNLMSDRPITEEDVADLMLFARQAALAVYTVELQAEIRRAEETLVRSEKLRAVGELASGVAHNVNNVLAAVQGYSELIQDAPAVTAEIGHYARIIERAVQDGAAMVQRIQHFARTENEACAVPFELSLVAREAIDLTRPTWHNQAQGRGIKVVVETELTPGLQALGVASEIREVLVNLIKNAVDAMHTGGVVTVRCYAEQHECVYTVTDTGAGMDQETCQGIFEPFFTTKSNGRGTGLGLSVAWGIIARHNGRIRVESEVGRGTTFTINLPRVEGVKTDETARCTGLTLKGLRVLLVEDEELVAGGMARILAANGAHPILAQDAEEALIWLEAHADACDIILSDHGLTGCTGLDLLGMVSETYPRLHRVLLSGWGHDLPGVTDTSAADLVLAKPIRQDQLIAALLSLY